MECSFKSFNARMYLFRLKYAWLKEVVLHKIVFLKLLHTCAIKLLYKRNITLVYGGISHAVITCLTAVPIYSHIALLRVWYCYMRIWLF